MIVGTKKAKADTLLLFEYTKHFQMLASHYPIPMLTPLREISVYKTKNW